MCYYQIDTFAVNKDEWDTKEDTGAGADLGFIKGGGGGG